MFWSGYRTLDVSISLQNISDFSFKNFWSFKIDSGIQNEDIQRALVVSIICLIELSEIWPPTLYVETQSKACKFRFSPVTGVLNNRMC